MPAVPKLPPPPPTVGIPRGETQKNVRPWKPPSTTTVTTTTEKR